MPSRSSPRAAVCTRQMIGVSDSTRRLLDVLSQRYGNDDADLLTATIACACAAGHAVAAMRSAHPGRTSSLRVYDRSRPTMTTRTGALPCLVPPTPLLSGALEIWDQTISCGRYTHPSQHPNACWGAWEAEPARAYSSSSVLARRVLSLLRLRPVSRHFGTTHGRQAGFGR
jgi:hypothetical protein